MEETLERKPPSPDRLGEGRSLLGLSVLFAKQDQSNITQAELAAFRELAKAYEGLSNRQVQQLLDMKEFVEINHE